MSGSIKLAFYIFAAVLTVYVAIRVVKLVVSLFVPVVAVIGIAALLYVVVNRKALGPGGRRILP
ncbi:MAG TPA: hypothetical protein VG944_17960 [Fimbriimonas sp.]|nr:hypothetical protein [Fimbriimonas sp.]